MGTIRIEHWTGTFEIAPGQAAAGAARERSADLEAALFSLRQAFARRERAVVSAIERWHESRALGASVLGQAKHLQHGLPWNNERVHTELWESFEREARLGSLQVRRVERESAFVDLLWVPKPEAPAPRRQQTEEEVASLYVEWWDSRGRNRHVECSYSASGPASLSGKTDDAGRLYHHDVPVGEYTVKLTVEYFHGKPYATSRDFEEKVLVQRGSGLKVFRVGPVPELAFRRVRGYVFDRNKSFLMPGAVRSLLSTAEWWKGRTSGPLLIVGHTDATGEPAVNDPLSKARADVVKAFLEQDVDAWLAHYDKDGKGKWGAREDRLMIRSMPDFGSYKAPEALSSGAAVGSKGGAGGKGGSEKPETMVEWFQRTRDLKVDGIAGPKTRRALVGEYMGASQVVLRETKGFPTSIATSGAGEHFPLADTGLPLDAEAATDIRFENPKGNALDRRVELFFFDTDFGLLPAVGAPGGAEYLEWRARASEESELALEHDGQLAHYLGVKNAQFRTGSAVMLPEGSAPGDRSENPLTSVGILATALRYNEERPGHKLLIAGHTDSVGSDKDNDELSSKRAELVHAVMTGGSEGRTKFQDLANETGKVSDWKQILKWASVAFPSVEELVSEDEDEEESAGESKTSDSSSSSSAEEEAGKLGTGFTAADPGAIDDDARTGEEPARAFQTAYNENYKLLGGPAELTVDGKVGKKTWGAIYDLYQYNLAQELGEDFNGLKELQGLAKFLETKKPFIGFGESAPVDGSYDDDTESQEDRRVEVLFFEEGQEPNVALLDEDPKVSELYQGDAFRRVEIEEFTPRRVAVRIKLETIEGLAIPGISFIARTQSGAVRKGQLNGLGLGNFKAAPGSRFSIEYLEPARIRAIGLAARLTKALDERDHESIFGLLHRSRETFDMVKSAVDEHFPRETKLVDEIRSVATGTESIRGIEHCLVGLDFSAQDLDELVAHREPSAGSETANV